MPLRALVVDDTITYRKILGDVLKDMHDIELAGTAPSGAIALKKIAAEPIHVVFLDVHMPDMDGVETLKHIKKDFPLVSVVMVSGISTRSADTTIEALELGAVDFIRKPDSPDAEANRLHLKADIQSVLRLIQIKQMTTAIHSPIAGPTVQAAASQTKVAIKAAPVAPVAAAAANVPRTFGVCVIGVSTGGPEALSRLIPAFKGPLSVPILCVQHMPPMFTKSLADSLAKKSKFRVVEAVEDEAVLPGIMYIAPGGHHMVVRSKDGKVVIGINDAPPENSCRPSVDVLFRSVATVYGDRGILSTILTGMGNDGCNGVRTMKRKGCYSITQTEQSCVVYGMPRAVDEAGLSDKSLPLESIAPEIESLIQFGRK